MEVKPNFMELMRTEGNLGNFLHMSSTFHDKKSNQKIFYPVGKHVHKVIPLAMSNFSLHSISDSVFTMFPCQATEYIHSHINHII